MNFLTVLKSSGLTATPQRVAVLKELGKKTHPTMEEIYNGIREENPTISLATVYKNVHVLKENGMVIEINIPNGKMRYDYLAKPHIHIVCKSCSYIEDMDYDENLFKYQNNLEKSKNIVLDRLDVIATVDNCKMCK
ncbi:Fur family transcriptional regulator [Sulfurospirillum arcachonense]|uniref:Fur family transcriptional regulator n=1 Tax=Sulfurospirillum arcachonense TaxID=57666 RepID=UPI000468FC7B|nr:transcriptional repressor [Sulfurospirillum arcachonense]